MLIDSDDFCIPSSFEGEKSEMHNSGWTRRPSYIVWLSWVAPYMHDHAGFFELNFW